jgi:hypothetical protein
MAWWVRQQLQHRLLPEAASRAHTFPEIDRQGSSRDRVNYRVTGFAGHQHQLGWRTSL